MFDRRALMLTSCAMVASLGVPGLAAERVYRIGVLGRVDERNSVWSAFVEELATRGYVQGRNLAFEARTPSSDWEGLQKMAAELVALKVDVIYTSGGTPTTLAARAATSTIPIVMLNAAEPVRDGLIAGFAHPGGNVTGNAILGRELAAKRLQLIAEVTGQPHSVAYLVTYIGRPYQSSVPANDEFQNGLVAAAHLEHTTLNMVEIPSLDKLESTFDRLARDRTSALVVDSSSVFLSHAEEIASLALRFRIPAIAEGNTFASAGLLMTYGANFRDLARKAAVYVDQILRGAKAGDLPVEQASSFTLVLNMKTASSLGIAISQSLLLRADQVIT